MTSPTFAPHTATKDIMGACVVIFGAVLIAGCVPLGAPIVATALMAGGWSWRQTAAGSPGPRILLAGGTVLILLIMVVVVFGLAV